jgi:transcriptional regulator of acetoin/glycerol metabolism
VEHVNAIELRQALARNHDLLAHSRPVMDYLFEQVRHSQGMVILADQSGTLMHTLGHADFLDKAQRVALTSGASWLEQHRGTNAIGTALAELEGIEIHGAEHFFERNAFLSCTAAPIVSAQGELMGILDISGDQRNGHPHTLGLVGMAARMIENRLMLASSRCQTRLHLHPQREGIGTVAEGIVALSEDGWIVGANRNALTLLGLTGSAIGTVPLTQALDVRWSEVLSRHRRNPDQPMQLRQRDGSTLYGLVQAAQASLQVVPPAVAMTQPQDALAQLDTGDLRWRSAADKARRVLDKPIPLLIQGESGVGKELFARAAHDSGPRRHKPFVAINCAAVPENLIEAELFGYAPGAFTGARREGSPGRLREAHGGTLFLDEIGDMPLGLQARLLRVLQERQVSPLGGAQAVAVDFALICASHRKLRDEAAAGRFRNDLYYRINGLTVLLPPLRERTDFAVLVQRLLADLNPQRHVEVEPELLQRLSRYAWPGNLRQCANALRTASAMLDSHEDCITWAHLPDDLAQDLMEDGAEPLPATRMQAANAPAMAEGVHNLQELSRTAIRQALDRSCGNMSQAARALGISRQTLYRKLSD